VYQVSLTFCLFLLHRSEQYLTSSHTFAHFFRQANGRPHTGQVFVGKSLFFIR
jgi:hypothetical protein